MQSRSVILARLNGFLLDLSYWVIFMIFEIFNTDRFLLISVFVHQITLIFEGSLISSRVSIINSALKLSVYSGNTPCSDFVHLQEAQVGVLHNDTQSRYNQFKIRKSSHFKNNYFSRATIWKIQNVLCFPLFFMWTDFFCVFSLANCYFQFMLSSLF